MNNHTLLSKHMQQPPALVPLLLDAPLLAQGKTLDSAARKKIMSSVTELDDMKKLWIKLLEEKAAAIKEREEMERFRKYKRECTRAKEEKRELPTYARCDKLKYFFDSRNYMSVVRKMDLVRQCLEEIRADFKRSGEDLPWPECIPLGIRSAMPLLEYINAWVAEEDAAAK